MREIARPLSFALIAACMSSALLGCSLHKYPLLDTRTTKSVLADYEQSAYPKDVIKFLFRHGRKKPAHDELVEVAKWSLDNRILFIRLVDKLKDEYKDAFLQEFPRALSASEYQRPFEEEYRSTKAPSVQRILEQLPKSDTDVASATG